MCSLLEIQIDYGMVRGKMQDVVLTGADKKHIVVCMNYFCMLRTSHVYSNMVEVDRKCHSVYERKRNYEQAPRFK